MIRRTPAFILLLFFIFFLSSAIAERGVTVKGKQGTKAVSFKTNYYALVIGNNDYRSLPRLKTAVSDAKEVGRVLAEKYGFRTKVLTNATRHDILNAINEYRKSLGEKDSFLIYYAGHGEYDKTAEKSYWLPVDAERDNPADWIMAEDITSNIKRIAARHVIVIADSCYSGTLTRSANIDLSLKKQRDDFLKKMMERQSRTLMASGGNEPVADAGGRGNHSVFASAFLMALNEPDKKTFTAEELFHGRVKAIVAGRSEQVPQYSNIRNSGDEGGDFVFQLAQATGSADEEIATDAGVYKINTPAASDEADMAHGNTPSFYSCGSHTDCQFGNVCVDNGGDKQYYCKPICENDDFCRKWPYPLLRCYEHQRVDGTSFMHRVCNDNPSWLHP